MKILKYILIIVFACITLTANSQIKRTGITSKNEGVSELFFTIKMDSVSLISKVIKIKGVSSVEMDTENQLIVVKYDGKRKRVFKKIKKIKTKIKIKTSIVENLKPLEEIELEQFKFNPEIDKFLNIEDSSIFSDEKFMKLSDEQIEQIHPRSREYYLLINNIYNLKNQLIKVLEFDVSHLPEAKEKLSEVLDIIHAIKDTEKCYKLPLSEEQKDFYSNRVKEFNRLYEGAFK